MNAVTRISLEVALPTKRPRRKRLGVTLIELVVGTFIALFLTGAAVLFASHETKLLGYSTEQVDMQQQARAAIELMTSDLQMAGAGIGYNATGDFMGLLVDTFTAPGGGLQFNTNGLSGTPITLIPGDAATGAERSTGNYTVDSHDLGILIADGTYATIASFDGAGGEFCDETGSIPSVEQLVVFRTEEGLSAFSTLFTPTTGPGVCTYGQCAPFAGNNGTGCRTFTLLPDPNVTFTTDAGASGANYTGGEVQTGLKMVVWFVENAPAPDDNLATLRRAVLNNNLTCGAGTRATCGDDQAYNVETLQYTVWRYDETAGAWSSANPTAANNSRLRVDVELVVRSRVGDGRRHDPIQLRLAAACIPNDQGCPPPAGAGDFIMRRAYRWSVEVRNSARMEMERPK